MIDKQFDQYKNLIYSLVRERWQKQRYSRPDVSFDDLLSEGYYIYSWCLNHYDGSKNAKFITYLYIQLKGRLVDYYKITHKKVNLYEDCATDDAKSDFESCLNSLDYKLGEDNTLYKDAEEQLSYEGNQVFRYLLSCKWMNDGRRKKPSYGQINEKFGYPYEVIDSIMGEIRMFWNKNYKQYC